MSQPDDQRQSKQTWRKKFACAFRGIAVGLKGQNSFVVHVPAAVVVMLVAVQLECSQTETAVLLLCIAGVWCCELINSSIETLASRITNEYDDKIRDCLDIASGAVLFASMVSVIVAMVVLGPKLWG